MLIPGRPYLQRVSSHIGFNGNSTYGLAGTNTTFFTVTGEVLIVYLVPFCTLNMGEAAPTAVISLGVVNALTLFIANTNSVDIDTNEFWTSATPTANGVAVPAALKNIVISSDIVAPCTVQNTNAGQLRLDCYWQPLSSDGLVSSLSTI